MYLALPLITLIVLLLTYFGLFSSPLVIAILLVLYVVVSLSNRRKFRGRDGDERVIAAYADKGDPVLNGRHPASNPYLAPPGVCTSIRVSFQPLPRFSHPLVEEAPPLSKYPSS